MTFIEFLGFIISFGMMIFLVFKRFWEENQRRRYPDKYAEMQRKKEKILSDIMNSLEISEKKLVRNEVGIEDEYDDEEDIKSVLTVTPKPLPPPIAKSVLRNSMLDSYREGMVSNEFLKEEASAYDLNKHRLPSRASVILNNLPSSKNMLVIKEIFGPPISMQNNPWNE